MRPTESIAFIDIHLARLLQKLNGDEVPSLFAATALVSSQTRAGHICLDVNLLDDVNFRQENLCEQEPQYADLSSELVLETLRKSSVVGKPGDFRPLILDDANRLYLQRYWHYENIVTQFIKKNIAFTAATDHDDFVKKRLSDYFPPQNNQICDWQKVAAATALLKKFCVITGGPGTGKTHVVAKVIALFLEQDPDRNLKIKLAAPTGKAAVRLQESIQNGKHELPVTEELKQLIPNEASTIHRLLGTIRHSPNFWHNSSKPLEVDILIIDEASMVDLALMAKLVKALPETARLILLGDHNQLASVEAGSILADVCGDASANFSSDFGIRLASLTSQPVDFFAPARQGQTMLDCIVHLRKSYRFDSEHGIGAVSEAVKRGDADIALEILKSDDHSTVSLRPPDMNALYHTLLAEYAERPEELNLKTEFAKMNQFRILCCLRAGPQGVHMINEYLQQILKRKKGVDKNAEWYPGLPVMITENNYQLNLFNGDIGLIFEDSDSDGMLVFFPGKDGQYRHIRPFRLPKHETAYAMTIHKSQGSEFDRVLVLLPEQDSLLLSRELIYTAITRASTSVEIWGDEDILRAAIKRQIHRSSGLKDALWHSATPGK